MKIFALLSLSIGLLVMAPADASARQDRVLVRFAPGKANEARAAAERAGGVVHHTFQKYDYMALSLPTAAIEQMKKNPNVIAVTKDAPKQMSAEVVPYGVTMVQAVEAWNTGTVGANVTVCIIDSGIARTHEDLQSVNVLGGTPADFASDACGHGTHVAGTITAAQNGVGVVGVSPGAATLYIVKVFGDDCSWSYSSDLVAAALQCQSAGADVISMSLGGGSTELEEQAFNDLYSAGILSIAAAGNDGNEAYSYPASYDSVMSVAAIDANGDVASFSQKNDQVEIAAPGVGVLSTVPWVTTAALSVGTSQFEAWAIAGAKNGSASGALVNGGNCATAGSWRKKVVLCGRDGQTLFSTMVASAGKAGAKAVVIYNNVDAPLHVEVDYDRIPGVTTSLSTGQALLTLVTQTATVSSNTSPGSGYEEWNGTSMATPHVSGVAALVWSAYPALTHCQVRHALDMGALDLGAAGRDDAYGFGLLQAKTSLALVPAMDNVPPMASFTHACTEASCVVDAAASSDCDGTVVGYQWALDGVVLPDGAAQVAITASTGMHLVALTVTDNDGATAGKSVEIFFGTATGDSYEPNNSNLAATPLSLPATLTGTIYPTGDEDWFAVALARDQVLQATLSSLPGDYDFYLVDSRGTVVASGATVDDPEVFSYTARRAGTYFILVIGYAGAMHPIDTYVLSVQ